MTIDWKDYETADCHDEMIDGDGMPRPWAAALAEGLAGLDADELAERQAAADLACKEMGISFTVYNDEEGSIDRLALRHCPRIIPRPSGNGSRRGSEQRVHALNLFIDDLYHEQKIIKDGVFPARDTRRFENFRPQCVGIDPPLGVWAHICGSDLVRDGQGTIYVLEDNLRVPSGVSYMLENRLVTKRVFPELFDDYAPLPVDDYPSQLFDTLAALSPRRRTIRRWRC